MHDVDAVVQDKPLGDETAVYELIALPPVDEGAVQRIVAEPDPAVAETDVGEPGAAVAEFAVIVHENRTDPELGVEPDNPATLTK